MHSASGSTDASILASVRLRDGGGGGGGGRVVVDGGDVNLLMPITICNILDPLAAVPATSTPLEAE